MRVDTRTIIIAFMGTAFVGCGNDHPKSPIAVQRSDDTEDGTDAARVEERDDARPVLWSADDIEGWTYHLNLDGEVAAYQFNHSGTVVATVGKPGAYDYPALFWEVVPAEGLFIYKSKRHRIPHAVLRLISIEGENVVHVRNTLRGRDEQYFRKRTLGSVDYDKLLPHSRSAAKSDRKE